ncbi:MAG: DUF1778 domain-containing protein [Burkholderiaceae bacterium]|nr:DUF1778 domain-containing protein [Burkholderiaceae bacterium]
MSSNGTGSLQAPFRYLSPGASRHAIEQAEVIRLSLSDQMCFAQALLSPPEPSSALERAFSGRNKLLRTE